jgi:hypothetical protein
MMDTPQQPALPNLPTPSAPPPMFGQAPQGKKPKAKSQQTTFLGSDAVPQSPGGIQGKTLMGQ